MPSISQAAFIRAAECLARPEDGAPITGKVATRALVQELENDHHGQRLGIAVPSSSLGSRTWLGNCSSKNVRRQGQSPAGWNASSGHPLSRSSRELTDQLPRRGRAAGLIGSAACPPTRKRR